MAQYLNFNKTNAQMKPQPAACCDCSEGPLCDVEAPPRSQLGFWLRQRRDAEDRLFFGCIRLFVLVVLLLVLFILGPRCCACLWIAMLVCLMLMTFLSMHFLWVLLVACFVATFWAGCQTGTTWLVIDSRVTVR